MIKSLGNVFAKLVASHVELHASETCRECGSQLARDTGDNLLNTVWHCPNPDCPPEVLRRVELWASPEAMDIPGCNKALVAQLVQRGLVRDRADHGHGRRHQWRRWIDRRRCRRHRRRERGLPMGVRARRSAVLALQGAHPAIGPPRAGNVFLSNVSAPVEVYSLVLVCPCGKRAESC